MKKIKIAFMAPETKGGPYYVYKEIVETLQKEYSDKFDVYFFNSKKDWLKLHFAKFDYIFSVIPFLFRPIGTKKYIFNLRGNYKIERKKKGLGVKLLYLTDLNFKFADKIMLTSYFLVDKLGFRKKYENKIFILPNFIDTKKYAFSERKFDNSKYKILTITSFKFYDKGRGILNLGKVVSELGKKTEKEIIWNIAGNDNSENFKKIKKEFDKIKFIYNVKINWLGWIDEKEKIKQLQNNDYFLYWTYLDNFPNVILEAVASGMKVLVNNFESFEYFLDEEIICRSEKEMIEKILNNYIKICSVEKFDKEKIISELVGFINLKD